MFYEAIAANRQTGTSRSQEDGWNGFAGVASYIELLAPYEIESAEEEKLALIQEVLRCEAADSDEWVRWVQSAGVSSK